MYPLFLSPLASVPVAHPLARFTSLWIEWQRLRGKDFQSISTAFATKGPYVQLAPRELAINDIEAVNCVWGIGTADLDKHPSYGYWATQGCVYLILFLWTLPNIPIMEASACSDMFNVNQLSTEQDFEHFYISSRP